jgi:hypothetical protein
MKCRKLCGTVIRAILVLVTSSAMGLGQNDPATGGLLTGNGEGVPTLFSTAPADQPQGAGYGDGGFLQSDGSPRWTVAADFIFLDRLGGANQTLVETVPRSVPYESLRQTPGTEALNSSAIQQGFCGGPRVDLIRRGDADCDLELSYFQIEGWTGYGNVGPVDPSSQWLVMRAPGGSPPGGFIQTNQDPVRPQAMDWEYGSKLYNAEFNVRWRRSSELTLLAGFRWVGLHESLLGALEPPFIPGEPPFWNATTTNNLYGFQIGADWKVFDRGRYSLDGLIKAGLFDNNALQTTDVSIHKLVIPSSASTNHGAGVGEIGLQCQYRFTEDLVLKAGYEVLWIGGVALAPGQIQETYINTGLVYSTVQAMGVNSNSSVFYHGATAGFEYSF